MLRYPYKSQSEEQQRVSHVIETIEKKEKQLQEKAEEIKENIIKIRGEFFEDVTVNIDDPDEMLETYASIRQQAEFLSERERTHGVSDQQIRTLRRLKDSPYFGRIDFREENEEETEQIYIGIASLMDQNDEEFLIYDWRAPIASLYYDYPPGEASFSTNHATIKGEMSLKRQYIIERGKIKGMFDTGLTIGDELLQEALGSHSSEQMSNIVATIQREQNQIIRNDQHKYLVVQGVAGSGKTSAALQRVAYLMYRYRDIIDEDEILLISPNPLFNSYVANVLPELGEANMRQTTFYEYISEKVDEDLTIETPFAQMEYILTAPIGRNYKIKMKSIAFQSSASFKEMLDEYIERLKEEGLFFKDIIFQNQKLILKEEIAEKFYRIKDAKSISNALTIVSEWLLRKIQTFKSEMFDDNWVMEEIEGLDEEELLEAYTHVQELEERNEFYDSGMEEEFLRAKIIERIFTPVEEGIRNLEFVDVFTTYRQMFAKWTPKVPPVYWNLLRRQVLNDLDDAFLSWENATPYIYFKDHLLGENEDRSVKYLFIDEAQDYTEFQLAYFMHIFPHTRMTFLGDVNQAILAHTHEKNPLRASFTGAYERIELNKSYRSTKQIVEFTRHISPDGDKIEPFERHGDKPTLQLFRSKQEQTELLLQKINDFNQKDHQMIAIICKTFAESEEVYEQLKDKLPVKLLSETSRKLEKGILILPIYLAKGIEFDAVIIPDGSEAVYADDYDQYLLYTACTRAMHDLAVLSAENISPFLAKIPEKYYELK